MSAPQVTSTPAGVTDDGLVDGLTTGYKWVLNADRTVDWSISNGFAGEYWIDPASVQAHVQLALRTISDYANIRFNYVGWSSSPALAQANGSEINVTMDGEDRFFSSDDIWARGFVPSAANNLVYPGAAGDVYLNLNSDANTLTSYDPGSLGWAVLLHELGHALGLKHPFDDGGTGHPTFEDLDSGDVDTNLWTMMSYTDEYDWNEVTWHPATPMILDVIALQYLYGKNTTTNAGDTVYDIHETDAYVTLWDAGGVDTLDFRHAAGGWAILLPVGPISSLVDTKAGFAVPIDELDLDQPHTMDWLAGDYEKLIGSPFGDLIGGNTLGNSILAGAGDDTVGAGDGANTISGQDGSDSVAGGAAADLIDGGNGDDSLDGYAGNDTLTGGLGADSMRGFDDNDSVDGGAGNDDLNGNKGDDTVHGGAGVDLVRGGQGNDVVYGDDGDDAHVNGSIGNDTVYGGAGADTVFGGQNDDMVFGDDGDDYISGDLGSDTLTGGAGADQFHLGFNSGHDVVTDFNGAAGDRVLLDRGATFSIRGSGADTVIALSGGEDLTLRNVAVASFNSAWVTVAAPAETGAVVTTSAGSVQTTLSYNPGAIPPSAYTGQPTAASDNDGWIVST